LAKLIYETTAEIEVRWTKKAVSEEKGMIEID
jgi:hypothetical protein